MKKKSIVLGVIVAVTLLGAVAVGTTVARIQDATNQLRNTFDLGSVKTEIEEGHKDFKNPRVENVGDSECLVRARVIISPAEAAECIEIVYPEYPVGKEWVLKEDGYYYYNDILQPKGFTEAIFETLSIADEVKWRALEDKNFEVTVYQESVQTVVYVNGEPETDPDEIWKLYEADNSQVSE